MNHEMLLTFKAPSVGLNKLTYSTRNQDNVFQKKKHSKTVCKGATDYKPISYLTKIVKSFVQPCNT